MFEAQLDKAQAELALLGGMAAVRAVDPDLAARMDKAIANLKAARDSGDPAAIKKHGQAMLRGFAVAKEKIHKCGFEPDATARDVLAAVERFWPGAALWDVRPIGRA